MRFVIGLLVATFAGGGELFADGSQPAALADKDSAARSEPRVQRQIIDTQALQNLIERLDRARGNRFELRAIDTELKAIVATAVKAGHTHSLRENSPRRAKVRSVRSKQKRLDASTRQALHQAAFQLRSLYGRVDAHSVKLRKELMHRLAKL